ncbi:hypothetical protein N0B31_02750 [Salinirubellus salinus]|uniref:Uncharacterized protein n=1 Tax=Salinirubellus salinus TaxID=1364945 RepID=A0A9E7R5U0_9EURY|nr:hypothetical protein [Salinirubellus salinus]UWM55210.1 hypothetical protein N0B31_02750 [Salinirubellus salinus]
MANETNLFINNGATGEAVEKLTNTPSAPGATPIVKISPSRGLFLRIANQVAKGSNVGVPVYMDLYDSNGDPIPPNSAVFFALEVQGMEQPVKVSAKKSNLSFYVANDITTQRDEDNIDNAKIVLQRPETSATDEPIQAINVRDIDAMYFQLEASAAVDWSQSEWQVDNQAVRQGER